MDPGVSNLEKCISSSWKKINEEVETYLRIVLQGSDCLSGLSAHEITLKNVQIAKLGGTDLINYDSHICQKLLFSIKKAISSEELVLVDILNNLQCSYVNIMTEVQRVSNVYSSCNLRVKEITKGSEFSFPLIEKFQVLEDFGRLLSQDHMKRKYSRDIQILSGDHHALANSWNASFIKTLQMNINWKFGVEDSLSEKTIVLLPGNTDRTGFFPSNRPLNNKQALKGKMFLNSD